MILGPISKCPSCNFTGKIPACESRKIPAAHSRSTLEVPIFWFIHGDPLLVDKHYQAKALSDMIILVQSEASSWESHLQCNGQSLLWDLSCRGSCYHAWFIYGF